MNDDEEKERIRRLHPLEEYLPARGIELKRSGSSLMACCPFHEDRTPSFSVDVRKQLWNCHGGCGGGDLFKFVMRFDDCDFKAALEKLGGAPLDSRPAPPPRVSRPAVARAPKPDAGPKTISKVYDYTDESGRLLYQVVRYEPKDFRQRRPDGSGGWVWNLEGIGHTIYQRKRIAENPSEVVWIVEGEKDANALNELGLVATCNSGGAGKWKEEHSRLLEGRQCYLCGDNDEPGRAHVDLLEKSLAGVAKSTRRVPIPSSSKDVSEYLASCKSPQAGALALLEATQSSPELFNGVPLPIRSMEEVSESYRRFIRQSSSRAVSLENWLPGLGSIRPIVPGEMVTILAGTGVGKTAILQNIALAIAKRQCLYTLFFELELPETLTFERFVALQAKTSGGAVWSKFYKNEDDDLEWYKNEALKRIFLCDKSGLSVETMSKYVSLAHLKMGVRPACVMIDYFSLIGANGSSRYERMSAAAEEIKVMAKETNTVVICTSQVARKEKDAKTPEVFLHDAKDSGSIENSSGLVLGAWREPGDEAKLHLKILKSTKGGAGKRIVCRVTEALEILEQPA